MSNKIPIRSCDIKISKQIRIPFLVLVAVQKWHELVVGVVALVVVPVSSSHYAASPNSPIPAPNPFRDVESLFHLIFGLFFVKDKKRVTFCNVHTRSHSHGYSISDSPLYGPNFDFLLCFSSFLLRKPKFTISSSTKGKKLERHFSYEVNRPGDRLKKRHMLKKRVNLTTDNTGHAQPGSDYYWPPLEAHYLSPPKLFSVLIIS